ncbi:MAG TPA: hypothetical protein VLA89_15825 [Gemmatimonadales bacterium]|nr:hypothetical protein [Gemmatimonadales bacterium]
MPTRIEQLAIRHVAEQGGATLSDLRKGIEAKWPGAIARKREAIKKERIDRALGKAPAWARTLIKRHARGIPEVSWHRSRINSYSSGRCNWSRIHVTEGSNPTDARFVLLHEIAHWNATGFGHDEAFYDTLVPMLKREGLLRYGQTRDGRNLRSAAKRARGKG